MESWIIGMSHISGKSKNDDTEGSGPRPPVPGEECCVGKVSLKKKLYSCMSYFLEDVLPGFKLA